MVLVVVGWPDMRVAFRNIEFRNNMLHFCFRVTSIGFVVKWLRFLSLWNVGLFVSDEASFGGNVAKTLAGEGGRVIGLLQWFVTIGKRGKGEKGKM